MPTDNSAAVWAFTSALHGIVPTPEEIRPALERGMIPIARMLPQLEKKGASYLGTLKNEPGWKLAHIEGIGMNPKKRLSIEDADLQALKVHFTRFVNPANMFLVPKAYGSLGELEEFRVTIAAFDLDTSLDS